MFRHDDYRLCGPGGDRSGGTGFLRVCEEAARISAAALLETRIVINRGKGEAGLEVLRRFIADAAIEVDDFNEVQSRIAFDAHLRFGKGMGHPAQLNILDCCSYALAKCTDEPLLFKGNDFAQTDIRVA